MVWTLEGDLAFAPTPTPTATYAPRATATADFRATRVAEDIVTQEAFRVAMGSKGQSTPSLPASPAIDSPLATPPALTESPPSATAEGVAQIVIDGLTPSVTRAAETSVAVTTSAGESTAITTPIGTGTEPGTGTTLNLPIISNESPATTAPSPTPPAPTATTTPTLIPAVAPSETPSPTPTQTPVVQPTDTPTPTAFAPPPTDTPTVTPTAIPTFDPPTNTPVPATATPIYAVSSLKAKTRSEGVNLRAGPSNFYSQTVSIAGDSEVKLHGRDRSGEWVYVCCVDNELGWVRQAYARAQGNELADGAPEEINPNDVQWLPIQPLAANVTPIPSATAVPPGDFPLVRYDPSNRANVPARPNPPVQFAWPSRPEAGQAFSSPVIVAGSSV
ncbi:MAG: SH3 domain-containing protein, partial [Caldilineaceae bacterium]|nr:SH3 domain-containing protein [Caldilineaceae bacterium]